MGYEIFEKLCKERGITPYIVAKNTGVSTSTLSSWKTGRYQPKSDKLQRIADYFDVPLAYLLSGDEALNKPIPHTADEYDKAENILRMYGWEVSKNKDGVSLMSEGIMYTVTKNAYEVFCEEALQLLEKSINKLLNNHVVEITIRPVSGTVSQDKIRDIARIYNETLQAAHADDSATKEQLQSDIDLLKKKDEDGDIR